MRALDPVGQVTIDGERWKARCATGAALGARVVIERIEGLTLEVKVYIGRERRRDRRPVAQRLKHDAVALGELQELIELLLRGVALDVEAQADVAETHRRLAVDAERAAEVEVALGAQVRRRRAATPMAVATALSVTPAQATSASSSMSPEQASRPLPPVAGCRPAVTSARPVSTLQAMPASSMSPSAAERDDRRARARPGTAA